MVQVRIWVGLETPRGSETHSNGMLQHAAKTKLHSLAPKQTTLVVYSMQFSHQDYTTPLEHHNHSYACHACLGMFAALSPMACSPFIIVCACFPCS